MFSNPYGKLPVIGVWALFGSCFYFFLAYQSMGERGAENRKWIGEMLRLTPPTTENKGLTDHQALLEATTHDPKNKDLHKLSDCEIWVTVYMRAGGKTAIHAVMSETKFTAPSAGCKNKLSIVWL